MASPTSLLRRAYRTLRPAAAQVEQPRPDLPRLFFLHVPKCGGTSVDKALRRVYQGAGYRTEHLDSFASLKAAELANIRMRPCRDHLLYYHMAQKNMRYLGGHFSYSDTARAAFADWRYVTLLREPVTRWLSHYFYNKYKQGDHFRIKTPLEAFVRTERARGMGNTYTEWFADDLAPEAARSDEAVEQAIRTLNNLEVVGLLEHLNIFADDCRLRLGVHIPVQHQNQPVQHQNRNPLSEAEQHEELSEDVLESIRALCAPDIRVYEAVQRRLAQGSWLTS